jgi:hypothetical protein
MSLLAGSVEEQARNEYFEKRARYLKTQKVTNKPIGKMREIDVSFSLYHLADETSYTIISQGCVIQLPEKLKSKISSQLAHLKMLPWNEFYEKNKSWLVGVEAPEAAVNGDYKVAAQFIKENLEKYSKINKVVVATWKDSLVTLVEEEPKQQSPKQDK